MYNYTLKCNIIAMPKLKSIKINNVDPRVQILKKLIGYLIIYYENIINTGNNFFII